MTERLKALADAGVSIWLDDLSRERIETGNLAELVKDSRSSASPRTRRSSPAALSDGERYDDQVRRLAADGADVDEAIFELTTDDVRNACDVLRRSTTPPTASTAGSRSRSTPASPTTPRHHRLGPRAVGRRRPPERAHQDPRHRRGAARDHAPRPAEGISVNVTLIFSLERYRAVMDAYLPGSSRRQDAGLDLTTIHSVASFFVSRVDTEVDKRLDAIGTDEARRCTARPRWPTPAWPTRRTSRSSPATGWQRSPRPGANPQRPLWASTGVKNPSYPDTLYVTDLVVADTVNTMPEKTLEAFADHGEVKGDTVTGRAGEAAGGLRPASREVGVDFDDVLAVLEQRGRREVREVVGRARRDGRGPDGEGPTAVQPGPPGTRRRRGSERRSSSSSATPTRRPSPSRSGSWSRTGVEPAGREGPHAVGAGRRGRRPRKRLSWVDAVRVLPSPRRRDRGPPRGAHGPGLTRVVLCGMGGSSLAPEVICAAAGVSSTSSTPPTPTSSAARSTRPARETVVVVSQQVRRHRRDRQPEAGLRAGLPRRRHRPGRAHHRGHRPRLAAGRVGPRGRLPRLPRRPDVGGRYSALTAFGLVPSGLAGADIGPLLDDADAIRRALEADSPDNPALRLGGLLGVADPPASTSSCSRRRGAVRRLRRLGRAADRRVDRQGRQGHPAGRGRGPDAPNFDPSTPDEVLATVGAGLRLRPRPPGVLLRRRGGRARWARRCCCGSTPPRSPGG